MLTGEWMVVKKDDQSVGKTAERSVGLTVWWLVD